MKSLLIFWLLLPTATVLLGQKKMIDQLNRRFPASPAQVTKVAPGITHVALLGRDTFLHRHSSINLVDIDLRKAKVRFDFAWFNTPSIRNVVSAVADTALAIVAINSGYFEILEGNTYVSFHKSKGVINQRVTIPASHQRFWKHQAAFVQTDEKTFAVIPGNEALYEKLPYPNLISSAPLLISNGVPVGLHFADPTADRSKLDGEHPDRHQGGLGPRVAYALTPDQHLLLLAVDGRSPRAAGMNAAEITQLLWADCGANQAINMDGGGSIAMFVRGATPTGVVNYPSDLRKTDPQRFEHQGQRRIGMALLVVPTKPALRRKMAALPVAPDTQAVDYLDVPKK